jgi:DNA polymerase/3'-5' exonuclease PolX
MKYKQALEIALKLKAELEPHCSRIEIAGSIRRKKPEVKDIEIVAIPKSYDIGLFQSGVAEILNKYPIVKGHLPCKYTQRVLPEGIKIDVFFAEEGNWGLIYAMRTGCAEFSHKVLARRWVKFGYKSLDGYLYQGDYKIPLNEEEDLFKIIKVRFIPPENRISGNLGDCLKYKN